MSGYARGTAGRNGAVGGDGHGDMAKGIAATYKMSPWPFAVDSETGEVVSILLVGFFLNESHVWLPSPTGRPVSSRVNTVTWEVTAWAEVVVDPASVFTGGGESKHSSSYVGAGGAARRLIQMVSSMAPAGTNGCYTCSGRWRRGTPTCKRRQRGYS